MNFLPDILTGYDSANAQAAAAADAKLRDLNQQKRDAGGYTDQQWYEINRDYSQQTAFDPAAQREQINADFVAGLDQGRSNTNSFIWGAIGQVLKSVPTAVWIGLAIAGFFWLGGFSWLAKNTKGKLT